MSAARWSDERIRHGGCLQQTAPATGRYSHAVAGGISCASMKSLNVGRDSRRFENRVSVLRQSGAKFRRKKVEVLRRKIKDGSYDVEWRLATILDKMIEELVAKANQEERP